MRPDLDTWCLRLAQVVAQRSTCVRRAVGCVLANRRGHVLATGCNGVAAGMPHCNEGHPCRGASAASGDQLDQCDAIHAEANALLQCRSVYEIHTCYSTVAPCVHCAKLLLNTGCQRVIYAYDYGNTYGVDILVRAGIHVGRKED